MIDARVSEGTRPSVVAERADGEPSMTQLVSGIADDAKLLLRQQFQMFRAEVREDLRRTISAVRYMGLGAAGVAIGFLFLTIAMPLLINWLFGFPSWAGWAIIGGVFVVLGVIALFAGKRMFNKFNPLPDKSMNALEENLSWITNHRN
jgi:hypothetical protein